MNGKTRVEREAGAEASEAKPEISFDELKEQVGEEAAQLALQVDDISQQMVEIRKQIRLEDQKAISLGMTEQVTVPPELVAEFQRLDAEWNTLMERVGEEVQKVDGLRKTENGAQAAEAGIDLQQREQQLTERVGKLEAKLRADQDKWAKLIDRARNTSVEQYREYDRAIDNANQAAREIGNASFAYLAAKGELAAIKGGEWSNKPPEDWLPSKDTELPIYNEEWRRFGRVDYSGGHQMGPATVMYVETLASRAQQLRKNKEHNMNQGTNIEDLVV